MLLTLLLAACGSSEPLNLTVTSPRSGSELSTNPVTVTGTVNQAGAFITYVLNGGTAQSLKATDTGFSFEVALENGANTLQLTASHQGETARAALTVSLVASIEDTGSLSASSPFFIRPDLAPEGLAGLSDAQRTVPYAAFEFQVDTADTYALESTQTEPFDGFLLLYSPSFDPDQPAQNLIAHNDDGGPGSLIVTDLKAATSYVLVTTACGVPAAGADCGEPYGSYSTRILGGAKQAATYTLPNPDPSRLDITLRFAPGTPAALQGVFKTAAQRWESILTSDQEDIANFSLPADFFFEGTAAVIGTLDDLLVDVGAFSFDGAGQVLGATGVVYLRDESSSNPYLPVYAYLFLDADDLDIVNDPDGTRTTVEHELGHALGFTADVWSRLGLTESVILDNPPSVDAGLPNPAYNPRFSGAAATAVYQSLLLEGGRSNETTVPLANTGGAGSVNSHWRELTFDTEEMTPFAGGFRSGADQLSKLSAALFEDLGYTVTTSSAPLDAYALLPLAMLTQTAPSSLNYTDAEDFLRAFGSEGQASGLVQAVDLSITNPAASTSGCEVGDYAAFTAGNIALLQRGGCTYVDKIALAEAAGAAAVVLFNQGDQPEPDLPARTGLFYAFSPGLPTVTVDFATGVAFAETGGVRLSLTIPNPDAALALQSLGAAGPRGAEELLTPAIGTVTADGSVSLFGAEERAPFEAVRRQAQLKNENGVR